jgi:hypothetical protein
MGSGLEDQGPIFDPGGKCAVNIHVAWSLVGFVVGDI